MTSRDYTLGLFDLPRRRLLKKGLKASIAIYATVCVCMCAAREYVDGGMNGGGTDVLS